VAIYSIDDHDVVIELTGVPEIEPGAPCPELVADEHSITLTYWIPDRPPYPPATAPQAIVRFKGCRFHLAGSPNDETLEGHALYVRGLRHYGAYRVENSSLIRHLARVNTVHPHHDQQHFTRLNHYIFTFHDSTFECVAESLTATIEQRGADELNRRSL
jgi:hypothetical protein